MFKRRVLFLMKNIEFPKNAVHYKRDGSYNWIRIGNQKAEHEINNICAEDRDYIFEDPIDHYNHLSILHSRNDVYKYKNNSTKSVNN